MQEEQHRSGRVGWLRAAVLGSDDAIVSVSSLIIGVAASSASKESIVVAGAAALVAGAMSMAVGEYVSVSSQRDAEQADIVLESQELAGQPQVELNELAQIYVKRGLDKDLAMKVAEQLSARDRLGAHLRDELGIDPSFLARPLQAAWISAASFASFAAVPILALLVAPADSRILVTAMLSLVSLAALGAFGGHLGGAPIGRAALRVTIGGSLRWRSPPQSGGSSASPSGSDITQGDISARQNCNPITFHAKRCEHRSIAILSVSSAVSCSSPTGGRMIRRTFSAGNFKVAMLAAALAALGRDDRGRRAFLAGHLVAVYAAGNGAHGGTARSRPHKSITCASTRRSSGSGPSSPRRAHCA